MRSPHDREILRLAVPALGALASEPLYVLVDTAIVGHLGTPELAALAIAAAVMTSAFTVFNFLTYGTTAQVARLHGARSEEHTSELQSRQYLVCRLLLEKKKNKNYPKPHALRTVYDELEHAIP